MTTLDAKVAAGDLAENNDTVAERREFHFPRDISYTCQNTGVCCTTFDTIPVGESCASLLQNLSQEQESSIRADARSGGQSFTAPGMPGDPPRLTRKDEGSCVFFDKDHLCAVHRIVGAH